MYIIILSDSWSLLFYLLICYKLFFFFFLWNSDHERIKSKLVHQLFCTASECKTHWPVSLSWPSSKMFFFFFLSFSMFPPAWFPRFMCMCNRPAYPWRDELVRLHIGGLADIRRHFFWASARGKQCFGTQSFFRSLKRGLVEIWCRAGRAWWGR